MILLGLVAGYIVLMLTYAALAYLIAGPDPDLTEADRDTMCYRCGVRGLKHVHLGDL